MDHIIIKGRCTSCLTDFSIPVLPTDEVEYGAYLTARWIKVNKVNMPCIGCGATSTMEAADQSVYGARYQKAEAPVVKKSKPKTWIVTDTHFGHDKLIQWGRPLDFSKRLLRTISSTVRPGDTLIHLGDFSIGNDELHHRAYLDSMPGVHHILVKGNHDGKSNKWYLERGWSFVCGVFADTYFGKNLLFTHTPEPKIPHAHYNIHGHTHGNAHRLDESSAFYDPVYHYDCAPELHDYKPIDLERLIENLKTR